jgi:hypothetical protein
MCSRLTQPRALHRFSQVHGSYCRTPRGGELRRSSGPPPRGRRTGRRGGQAASPLAREELGGAAAGRWMMRLRWEMDDAPVRPSAGAGDRRSCHREWMGRHQGGSWRSRWGRSSTAPTRVRQQATLNATVGGRISTMPQWAGLGEKGWGRRSSVVLPPALGAATGGRTSTAPPQAGGARPASPAPCPGPLAEKIERGPRGCEY